MRGPVGVCVRGSAPQDPRVLRPLGCAVRLRLRVDVAWGGAKTSDAGRSTFTVSL